MSGTKFITEVAKDFDYPNAIFTIYKGEDNKLHLDILDNHGNLPNGIGAKIAKLIIETIYEQPCQPNHN